MYGMHFYPGVAEYRPEGKDAFRVFLNENTIRNMGPTFAGCPVFVDHVDEVESNVNELRKEADGWVVESFFNEADGKHWVKFLVCSEAGDRAIKNGFKLSNCYIPEKFASGGEWNGVPYSKEITGATYEHLALVKNPRYEESKVLTPEQFKKYNDEKRNELVRFANNKDSNDQKGDSSMNLFKRTKVENAADLDGMCVLLKNSKKEMTLAEAVIAADAHEMAKAVPLESQMVTVGDQKMTVGQLTSRYLNAKKMNEEMEKEKKENKEEDDDDVENSEDCEPKKKMNKEKEIENAEDDEEDEKKKNEEEDKKALKAKEDEKEVEEAKNKKKNAKEKAEALRNAKPQIADVSAKKPYSWGSATERGKARYG